MKNIKSLRSILSGGVGMVCVLILASLFFTGCLNQGVRKSHDKSMRAVEYIAKTNKQPELAKPLEDVGKLQAAVQGAVGTPIEPQSYDPAENVDPLVMQAQMETKIKGWIKDMGADLLGKIPGIPKDVIEKLRTPYEPFRMDRMGEIAAAVAAILATMGIGKKAVEKVKNRKNKQA